MAHFDFERFDTVIPNFDGAKENLRVFVRRCTIYHDSLNAAGQGEFYENLAFKLDGQAFVLYEEGAHANWPVFADALIAFGNKRNRALALVNSELTKLTQGKESAEVFADRIRSLLDEMTQIIWSSYPEVAVRASFKAEHDKAAKRTFAEGLREPLRSRVVACASVLDFEDVVACALEEEPYAEKCMRKGHSPAAEYFMVSSRMDEGFSPVKERKRKQMLCYRCGRPGHIKRFCTTKNHEEIQAVNSLGEAVGLIKIEVETSANDEAASVRCISQDSTVSARRPCTASAPERRRTRKEVGLLRGAREYPNRAKQRTLKALGRHEAGGDDFGSSTREFRSATRCEVQITDEILAVGRNVMRTAIKGVSGSTRKKRTIQKHDAIQNTSCDGSRISLVTKEGMAGRSDEVSSSMESRASGGDMESAIVVNEATGGDCESSALKTAVDTDNCSISCQQRTGVNNAFTLEGVKLSKKIDGGLDRESPIVGIRQRRIRKECSAGEFMASGSDVIASTVNSFNGCGDNTFAIQRYKPTNGFPGESSSMKLITGMNRVNEYGSHSFPERKRAIGVDMKSTAVVRKFSADNTSPAVTRRRVRHPQFKSDRPTSLCTSIIPKNLLRFKRFSRGNLCQGKIGYPHKYNF